MFSALASAPQPRTLQGGELPAVLLAHFVSQGGLQLGNPPVSTSQVAWFQARATRLGWDLKRQAFPVSHPGACSGSSRLCLPSCPPPPCQSSPHTDPHRLSPLPTQTPARLPTLSMSAAGGGTVWWVSSREAVESRPLHATVWMTYQLFFPAGETSEGAAGPGRTALRGLQS